MNNKQFDLNNIDCVRDISSETAASYSGGAGLSDVTLRTQPGIKGPSFESDNAVSDLRDVGFNNSTGFIAINDSKTWRFYERPNFKGDFIDVGPDQARVIGDFGKKISSFRAVD